MYVRNVLVLLHKKQKLYIANHTESAQIAYMQVKTICWQAFLEMILSPNRSSDGFNYNQIVLSVCKSTAWRLSNVLAR